MRGRESSGPEGRDDPTHLCPLTATDENAPPQPANASAEDAHWVEIARDSMVLVVAQDTFCSHSPTDVRSCIRRRSSALMAFSFATIRFFAVFRQTMKALR